MPKNAPRSCPPALRRIFGPLALLAAVLSLPACSTTGTARAPALPAKVSAPEQCLPLAEPLPPLTDATLAGAVRNHVLAAAQYWELAERHRCLAEFEKQR